MKRQIVRKIRAISGSDNVQSSQEDLICYSYDATTESGIPDLVVHPGSLSEVVSIINTASEAGIPVIPRGAGTGLSGGAIPVRGGIVLHFDRMNRILDIDRRNMVAIVEPGAINWDVKQAAKKEGLFYPPDPGSTRVCTIGGNVAENAGGPYGTRYGVTGDYVLGLEAVLASGKVITTGGSTRRDVSGYDLTSLLVGSEGTLAVITKATLRLVPDPQARQTALIAFEDVSDASEAVLTLASGGIKAAALEIMDGITLRCLDEFMPGRLPAAGAMLLIEVDGDPDCVESEFRQVGRIITDHGGRVSMSAVDDRERDDLWDIRRAVSPALGRLSASRIGEDISVPVGEISGMIDRIQEIGRAHDLEIAIFGHAGDGNLHPNILTDRRDPGRMKRTREAISEIFEAALELGGALSGEHGIGTAKSGYMKDATTSETLAVMKSIKNLFDPHETLNPGKIFP